jgi:hypothetical protein
LKNESTRTISRVKSVDFDRSVDDFTGGKTKEEGPFPMLHLKPKFLLSLLAVLAISLLMVACGDDDDDDGGDGNGATATQSGSTT